MIENLSFFYLYRRVEVASWTTQRAPETYGSVNLTVWTPAPVLGKLRAVMSRPARASARGRAAIASVEVVEDGRRRKRLVASGAEHDGGGSEDSLEIHSREDLRRWLATNHSSSPSVWLVFYKRHHEHYVAYATFVEELICWGWIDSVRHAVDADRVSCRISRRNPRSAWSAVNKEQVVRARSSGAMTAAGEAVIAEAMANGCWAHLDDVEAGFVPPDLAEALSSSGVTAERFWESQPRSVKRFALQWVKSAKTPETRGRRISDVVQSAARGLRPAPLRVGK